MKINIILLAIIFSSKFLFAQLPSGQHHFFLSATAGPEVHLESHDEVISPFFNSTSYALNLSLGYQVWNPRYYGGPWTFKNGERPVITDAKIDSTHRSH